MFGLLSSIFMKLKLAMNKRLGCWCLGMPTLAIYGYFVLLLGNVWSRHHHLFIPCLYENAQHNLRFDRLCSSIFGFVHSCYNKAIVCSFKTFILRVMLVVKYKRFLKHFNLVHNVKKLIMSVKEHKGSYK